MSLRAKAYITLTAMLGVLILRHAPAKLHPEDGIRLLCYLTGAVLTSQLKVRLPGITGTMSVNFFFIMLGILEMDLRQVLIITSAGTLGQMLWHARKRPRPVQAVFNLANVIIASYCAYTVYHGHLPRAFDGSLPVLLFASTVIFFLVNTLTVSGVVALTEDKGLWDVWRESFVWTAAQYLVVGALAGIVHAVDRQAGWQITLLLLPVVYLVYRSYDLYLGRLEEEKRHVTEIADLHLRTIEALAMAIDAKDDTTHDHLRRVKVYATEIGRELCLAPVELQALEAAALLHDIGKLAVPEYIISKPGKLTPEEFEKMKIHPLVGAEILERVQFPYPVVPLVRAHHEKWDGSGYSDGLKGDQIPMGARIPAVVDCLDALASDRQYRRAFPMSVALEKVVAESGIWLSSGSSHAWNPGQSSPETPWEAEIDRLMRAQATELSPRRRKALVDRMQEIVAAEAPMLYLVDKDSLSAVSASLGNASPVVLFPQTFWNIDRLYFVRPAPGARH